MSYLIKSYIVNDHWNHWMMKNPIYFDVFHDGFAPPSWAKVAILVGKLSLEDRSTYPLVMTNSSPWLSHGP
jgi:hypothetical protein